MNPEEEQLARLAQNPGNWSARAELAHIWRDRGYHFTDGELLSRAIGAPHNRKELQHLLDALDGPPRVAAWAPVLEEYLRWSPGCPLGLTSLAHVVEEIGKTDEALELYQNAVRIDPSVAEPLLMCLRQEEERVVPRPAEEPSNQKLLEDTRFISLMIAIGVHVFLIILFSLWAVTSLPKDPPLIVATNPVEDVAERPQTVPKKSAVSPASATTNLEIVSARGASTMSLPLQSPSTSSSPSLMGSADFSPSMDFGQNSGGSVSFFGSQGKTRNLVYVVDISGSMQERGENGKSRSQLMKEELTRSVSALPLSVKYQIIFFSNTAIFAGQNKGENGLQFQFEDNPESLPTRPLLRATRSQIRKTLEHIEDVQIGGGTNWRLPLKMAINLKPDLIYFMTDGEIDSDAGKVPVIDDIVEYNRKKARAKINTICLMEIKAYDELQELARRTQGAVFLVKEDGEVLRGMQIDQIK